MHVPACRIHIPVDAWPILPKRDKVQCSIHDQSTTRASDHRPSLTAFAATQYLRFGKLIHGKGKVWTHVSVLVIKRRVHKVEPDRTLPLRAHVIDRRRYTGIRGMIVTTPWVQSEAPVRRRKSRDVPRGTQALARAQHVNRTGDKGGRRNSEGIASTLLIE